ncbi:S8 family peptidase [Roseibium marinum]|uniref:Subtilase family protein n=1 Tax=Roseibium marinum TaxID=281252 RepID=A0A2S3UYB1_9HYPH|nr:S8 family serine peptidase [Roseibium marinum]POF32676.1 subtilase family protein [Roseibium marinum]
MRKFLCHSATIVPAVACLVPGSGFADEFSNQYGLALIYAEAAFQAGYTGSSVNIGIVDSGITVDHPDLAPNLSSFSLDGNTLGPVTEDPNGHGTHVAGIIGAARNGFGMMGVAPDAKLTALAIFDEDGDAEDEELEIAVPRVYEYGLGKGIEFFNNSWGGESVDPEDEEDIEEGRAYIRKNMPKQLGAFRNAANQGAVLVWATGNDSETDPSLESQLPVYFSELTSSWLAVTAVGRDGKITDYANWCGVAANWCLAAPGGGDDEDQDGIYSAANDGGYVRYSGTSMAAPHVTGALAIAREMYPNAAATDLAQLVLQTSSDIGAGGIDKVYGWGLLNIGNLVATRQVETATFPAQNIWAQADILNQIIDLTRRGPGLSGTGSDTGNGVLVSTHGANEAPALEKRITVQPIVANSKLAGSGSQSGATSWSGGVLGSMELLRTDTATLGAALGFTGSRVDAGGNRADVTGYHLAIFGAYDDQRLFADAAAGFSAFRTHQTRKDISGTNGTILGASGLTASSESTDLGGWLAARAGSSFETRAGALRPYVHGRLVHQWMGSYDESGAGVFNLSASADSTTGTTAGIGLNMRPHAADFSFATLHAQLDVAYARAIGPDQYTREVQLLGSNLTGATAEIGRDIAMVSAGMELDFTDSGLKSSLGYSGAYRENADSHMVSFKLSLRF